MRRRIDELKEIKLNKTLAENGKNRKNLKLIQEQQRQEDLQFLEEQKKLFEKISTENIY